MCEHQFGFPSGLCTSDAIVENLSHNICIRNENLKLVNDSKFLDIIIDDKLKFENQVNDFIGKLS